MDFIELNRFDDPSGAVFDAQAVLEKLCEAFPGVRVLTGDPLALAAERAASMGAAPNVVRTLRRNQQSYGPACAFEIDVEGGGMIQGRARRYDVTFLFDDSLTEEWRERIRAFLDGLGTGRIEQGADNVAKRA
jgi:hypothetical protein